MVRGWPYCRATDYTLFNTLPHVAEAADIIDLDDFYFHFECFTEGAIASISPGSLTAMGTDGLEGPELIGFTLSGASNIPGAMSFGNTVEIVINDAGEENSTTAHGHEYRHPLFQS